MLSQVADNSTAEPGGVLLFLVLVLFVALATSLAFWIGTSLPLAVTSEKRFNFWKYISRYYLQTVAYLFTLTLLGEFLQRLFERDIFYFPAGMALFLAAGGLLIILLFLFDRDFAEKARPRILAQREAYPWFFWRPW